MSDVLVGFLYVAGIVAVMLVISCFDDGMKRKREWQALFDRGDDPDPMSPGGPHSSQW